MKRLALAFLMTLSLAAFAADEPEFKLVIENHKFTPNRVEVPAGKKVKLVIENKDATPEEFESKQLNREKVIPGKSTGIVYVGIKYGLHLKFAGANDGFIGPANIKAKLVTILVMFAVATPVVLGFVAFLNRRTATWDIAEQRRRQIVARAERQARIAGLKV